MLFKIILGITKGQIINFSVNQIKPDVMTMSVLAVTKLMHRIESECDFNWMI